MMMVEPKYKDEVQVVLKPAHPTSKPKFFDRYIFLTKDNPKIFVGRSTKRDSRLAEGAKNAWFDSAVMSRNHAKFVFLPTTNTVALVDLGSLHGTFVNDKPVNKLQFRRLYQNDRIRFGVPIQKGSETFSPCEVKVALNHGSQNPEERPVVFKVPDSTDDEDEVSDVDETVETSISLIQKSGMALDNPQHIHAIDLTGEDDSQVPESEDDITFEMPDQPTPETKDPEETGSPLAFIRRSLEADDFYEENDATFSPPESSASSVFDSDEEDMPNGVGDAWRLDDMTWCSTDAPHDSDNVLEEGKQPSSQIPLGQEYNRLPSLDVTQTAQPSDVHLPSIFDVITPSSYQAPNLDKEISAQSLGAKSGKSEYFAAREHNRRLCFGSDEPKDNRSASDAEKSAEDDGLGSYSTHANILEAGVGHNCTSDSVTFALIESGEKFLQTPVDAPDEQPFRDNDYLDDTSAYTFELSKKAAELMDDLGLPGALQVGESTSPSGQEHSDAPLARNRRSTKRKSDAISELVPGEAEPSSSQTVNVSIMVPDESPIRAEEFIDENQAISTTIDSVDGRAAKRLRRVAEVVGFAALGGVAVLSALIATAPAL